MRSQWRAYASRTDKVIKEFLTALGRFERDTEILAQPEYDATMEDWESYATSREHLAIRLQREYRVYRSLVTFGGYGEEEAREMLDKGTVPVDFVKTMKLTRR